MSLFRHFNKDIISQIRDIDEEIGILFEQFKKAVSSYKRKASFLLSFLKIERDESMVNEYPELIRQFRNVLLEELGFDKKGSKALKRMRRQILSIIRKHARDKDLEVYENIDKELELLMSDLKAWRAVVLKQKEFLEENQGRIFAEHKYIIRHLIVLLKEEQEILLAHSKPSERELIVNLYQQVHSLVERWRPAFIGTMSLKEIKDPSDPDLAEFYNSVLIPCFPLESPEFKFFQEGLQDSIDRKFGDGKYHIIVIKNKNNQIIAGYTFYFLVDEEGTGISFGIGEYLAVLPEYRRYSIGTTMVALRLKILNRDAKQLKLRHVKYLFGEYHDEKRMTKAQIKREGFDPVARKRFWKRMHMRALDFDYKNPTVQDLRKIEQVYTLGFWTIVREHKDRIPSGQLLNVLKSMYKNIHGISLNHNLIRHMEKVFSRMKNRPIDIIPLLPD